MPKGLTVKQLIAHLSKYPPNLVVSMYRPPFTTAYRLIPPVKGKENRWLYNSSRLYIPIEQTINVKLPGNYKIPPLKKARGT